MRSFEVVPCLLVMLWTSLQPFQLDAMQAPIIVNSVGRIGGRFLVRVKPSYSPGEVAFKITNKVKYDNLTQDIGHAELVEILEGEVALAVMKLDYKSQLVAQSVEGVEYLEEDGEVKEEDIDEEFLDERAPAENYGLDRINQRTLKLDENATISGTGFGVNVYMLDTGIRRLHLDFECRAEHVYDAMKEDGIDLCTGHGTAVAGIVAGKTFGVAKKANIHSLRVIGCETNYNSNDQHAVSLVLKGIDWVVRNKVKPCVVVMALSTGASPTLDDAVKMMHDAGCVVVAAAGTNTEKEAAPSKGSGKDKGKGKRKPLPRPTDLRLIAEACTLSPARSPYVITAAAVDSRDNVPTWSNTGLCVDLFAPGSDIRTVSHKADDAYRPMSGTSMSAAYVAGVAAIHLANGVTEVDSSISADLINTLIKMRILKDATPCEVQEAGQGTPNRMLYI